MRTIVIKRSDIPAYLKSSAFYLSLNHEVDDDEEVTLPSDVLKSNTSVRISKSSIICSERFASGQWIRFQSL